MRQVPAADETSSRSSRKPFFRRRYLVDRPRQLRVALLATGLVVLLLAMVNVSIYMLRTAEESSIAASAPELAEAMRAENTGRLAIMLLLSAVLVLVVFAVTVFQTHRTAGAAFAVQRRLESIRDGGLGTTLKLRALDSLRSLEGPFNEMVAALRQQAEADAEALDSLASEADGLAGGDKLAAELRRLAADKRSQAE